jgi:hypothetical protein
MSPPTLGRQQTQGSTLASLVILDNPERAMFGDRG